MINQYTYLYWSEINWSTFIDILYAMNKLIHEEAYTPVIELAIHNPSGAETGIFWENEVNTMAADDLAPCINSNDIDYAEYMVSCLPCGKNSTTCTISVLKNDRTLNILLSYRK